MPTRTLILDGEKYSQGRFEEGIALVGQKEGFVCVHPKARSGSTVLGFTGPKSFLKWAKAEGFGDEVNRMIAADQAVQQKIRGLSETEATKLAQTELKAAKVESKRFMNVLKKEGIDTSDVKKIVELAKRGVIGSSILYKHINFDGFLIYISGGPYGIAYADFRWWGVNDKASSALALGGATMLYQHTWYRGMKLPIWGWTSLPVFSWFDFNDRASSAIGY